MSSLHGSAAMRNGPTPGSAATAGAGGAGISLDIDRIFAKKVSVYGQPSFAGPSLLQEYFRIVFKAMCELVRERTLVRAGFQQAQLCARFLHDMLPLFVGEDTEALDHLLGEFVNGAHARCLDPAPHENVERVVTKAKEQAAGPRD